MKREPMCGFANCELTSTSVVVSNQAAGIRRRFCSQLHAIRWLLERLTLEVQFIGDEWIESAISQLDEREKIIDKEKPLALHETTLNTWFERDRAHVELRGRSGETIVEWWDDDYRQAIEDGFLDSRRLHQTAFDYASENGFIDKSIQERNT